MTTRDVPQASEMPAITSMPVKWYPCGGLGCLWGPSLSGDLDTPEAILAAMPKDEREGWIVEAGDIWCPHHHDSGKLKALWGCDECVMPEGKHYDRCARLLAERQLGLAHAEAVKRDPVWMSSDTRRLQDELREARSVLSALLLPTGHLMGEGEVCTPECQDARRIAGVTYDERHLPLGVTVTPPPAGVQLVRSLEDVEGGFKRGHVTVIGAPLRGIPRHSRPSRVVLGLEDIGGSDTLEPASTTESDVAFKSRMLLRLGRFLLGDRALDMPSKDLWRELLKVLVQKLKLADEHAQMERRLDAMADALTEAVEAERTARESVRLARSDLSGAYVWEGAGALDAIAIDKPVIMSADTCRELLHAAVAAGQGGHLAGDIADIIRARTLLGVRAGAPMTPVVEGVRELLRELGDSHLELHDWDVQAKGNGGSALVGAGMKAFEDIGRILKAINIVMNRTLTRPA